MLTLATCGESFQMRVSGNSVILYSGKRKLRIIWDSRYNAIGGSDIIISQFPSKEQICAIRGGAVLITHPIMDLESDLDLQHTSEKYQVLVKRVRVKRKLRWGAKHTKVIGPLTKREREQGMRA